MKMSGPSEEARAVFSGLVPDEPALVLRPMFGHLAAFVNGNMFAGLYGEDLFVRLPDDQAAAVKASGGRDFEPMPGRAMRGYVIVGGDWRTHPPAAEPLVRQALALARQLPAKEKKAKARRPPRSAPR